ncbi:hypothetical protein Agabi119p4_8701 [Agaricus bisporus var. burnettii]|uniref:Uncharacterized protein n=1 Tax=Agaricus bisporus var. burnettii TaxID=192524 RepID=A0A8H7C4X5_AGABI|nr:hypothetical protein Agabi119p4_8701 [Agaricus bisporus var. burnettii]
MPPLHTQIQTSSSPQPISQPHALSFVQDMPVGMFDGTHHPRAREDIHTVDAPRVEDIEGDHGFERHEQRQWPRHHPYGMGPAQHDVGTASHQIRTCAFSRFVPDRTVIRPEVLYAYPPLTARSGAVCNSQEVDECIDHFLDLIGWGVPPEYIADMGFSVAGVIWLCAALHIRLSWGIVLRAHESRIPFHPLSIMPDDYDEYNYANLRLN